MFYVCPKQTPRHASVIPPFVYILYVNIDKSIIYSYWDQCKRNNPPLPTFNSTINLILLINQLYCIVTNRGHKSTTTCVRDDIVDHLPTKNFCYQFLSEYIDTGIIIPGTIVDVTDTWLLVYAAMLSVKL